MLRLVKQMFIRLLIFSAPLATKCMSLNNEPCITRPTFIDVDLLKFSYYPFLINSDKCNGNHNNAVQKYVF